jgi:hypothetical protein
VRLGITRYQALPGNADQEALPRIFMEANEAEPLDIGTQAEPGNQLIKLSFVEQARCLFRENQVIG